MSASKDRPVWDGLPAPVRVAVERVVGGPVVEARTCPGGFSPGFASVLTRADGHRVFVKAVDVDRWPADAALHRAEAEVTAVLPASAGAPRLLGAFDDGHWVGLAFEAVDGVEPRQPWDAAELDRVVTALLARGDVPAPAGLSHDHLRLGGWAALADRRAHVAEHSPWAADHLPRLVELEREGLAAARGDSLVHFDLYPHNVLLTPRRVVVVDWPHARAGAPLVDLVTLLSSAAADGHDPDPVLAAHASRVPGGPERIDAILAAHTGFLVGGGLSVMPPGLEPIAAAKRRLGFGALPWLERRLR
ncbi:MAG TPA: phosphotransferase [Umezawaea sp.]|nr:phosphotransferase [Umezawaea sp.]